MVVSGGAKSLGGRKGDCRLARDKAIEKDEHGKKRGKPRSYQIHD